MNMRSPISVLQEITQQRREPYPTYHIETNHSAHFPFKCTVQVLGVNAEASAANKKDCKSKAAGNALRLLGIEVNNNKEEVVDDAYENCQNLPTLNLHMPSSNYVGQLNEFASGRQMSYPVYCQQMSAFNTFCVECKFQQFSAVGKGATKKQAKQDAAMLMLQRLKDEPDLQMLPTNFQNLSLTSKSTLNAFRDEILKKYEELPNFGINHSVADPVKQPVLEDRAGECVNSCKELTDTEFLVHENQITDVKCACQSSSGNNESSTDNSDEGSSNNPSNKHIPNVINYKFAETAITFTGTVLRDLQKTIKSLAEENRLLKTEQSELRQKVATLENEIAAAKRNVEKAGRRKNVVISGLTGDRDVIDTK